MAAECGHNRGLGLNPEFKSARGAGAHTHIFISFIWGRCEELRLLLVDPLPPAPLPRGRLAAQSPVPEQASAEGPGGILRLRGLRAKLLLLPEDVTVTAGASVEQPPRTVHVWAQSPESGRQAWGVPSAGKGQRKRPATPPTRGGSRAAPPPRGSGTSRGRAGVACDRRLGDTGPRVLPDPAVATVRWEPGPPPWGRGRLPSGVISASEAECQTPEEGGPRSSGGRRPAPAPGFPSREQALARTFPAVPADHELLRPSHVKRGPRARGPRPPHSCPFREIPSVWCEVIGFVIYSGDRHPRGRRPQSWGLGAPTAVRAERGGGRMAL